MKVQLTIRNRRYTMRGDEGVDIQAIAKYVDAKMREISDKPGNLDEYTIAMLAAMNIASDFERFRQEVDSDLASLDRDLASTAILIESALPGQDGEGDADDPDEEEP